MIGKFKRFPSVPIFSIYLAANKQKFSDFYTAKNFSHNVLGHHFNVIFWTISTELIDFCFCNSWRFFTRYACLSFQSCVLTTDVWVILVICTTENILTKTVWRRASWEHLNQNSCFICFFTVFSSNCPWLASDWLSNAMLVEAVGFIVQKTSLCLTSVRVLSQFLFQLFLSVFLLQLLLFQFFIFMFSFVMIFRVLVSANFADSWRLFGENHGKKFP